MKTLISYITAKVRGFRGLRSHRKIVSNVMATRDALYTSARHMDSEIDANGRRVGSILDRNDELRRARRDAKKTADRLTEFFGA